MSAERIERFCRVLSDTLKKKNAAYGDSAFRVPALAPGVSRVDSLLVRLSDKFARLEALRRGADDNGEGILDTGLDIAGYSVLIALALEDELTEKLEER